MDKKPDSQIKKFTLGSTDTNLDAEGPIQPKIGVQILAISFCKK